MLNKKLFRLQNHGTGADYSAATLQNNFGPRAQQCCLLLFYKMGQKVTFQFPGGVYWNFQLGPGSGQNEPRHSAVTRRAHQRGPYQECTGDLRRQQGCQPADEIHHQAPGRRLRKGRTGLVIYYSKLLNFYVLL